MYQNILVPVAPYHPANTQEAIRLAQALRAEGGKVTLISALDSIPAYVVDYLPEGQLQKNHADAKASLLEDSKGISDVTIKVVTEEGSAGSTIVEYAKQHKSDLIIIASHRPGLQDFFLGSTAARVVRHAPCAVHVVR
jgi:nucleotide-binding universal stress UspA family protein